ncbi:hypothetical protein GCM10011316_17440 [Roseibium aquae]|uniref:Gp5/Type VI secretion system Vgr protein OB-fold domain-containing protein n=1 Tax=Roseibium aquae TaxID=1323746 RepID=A0A916TKM6_9HYPH|nr:type VI secretion system tip protein TssI/VgrG [Roseibium aquae]GGB45848.1 hypothetical protein GCM10011316_17440 [Roseibium aquae]
MNTVVPQNRLFLTLPGKSKNDVHVEALRGHEALGKAYRFDVSFLSKDILNLEDMIAKSATIDIEVGDESTQVIGVIGRAESLDPTPSREFCYRVTVEPELALLRHSAQDQVYGTDKDLTVVEIIAGELSDANKASSSTSSDRVPRQIVHDMLASSSDYPKLDFVMQYRETDFDFLSRMCERFGIFFSFDHSSGQEKVVFGDRKEHFKKLSGKVVSEKLPYRSKQQVLGTGELGLWSFNCTYSTKSGTVALREYNPETPKVSLAVSENTGFQSQGVMTRYGENYPTTAEGHFIAKRRAERLTCERLTFRGESNVPNLRPGIFFELKDHPIRDFDGIYTVVEVNHHCIESTPLGFSSSDMSPEPYRNSFVCVPFDVGYRPALDTPKPIVSGYMIAIIDGESDGKRAELDSMGRYRVKFLSDESGLSKGRASHTVRKMEPYGGGDGYGSHSTLLVGTEVLIAFLEGDPDRPAIMGAVSNSEQTNPVTATNQNVAHRTRTASGIIMQISDGSA